jgi:signal transduction histidine kinase
VEALNRLVSDFLELDVIEQGNLKINPIPCNLNAIVLEVTDIMRAVAKRKNISVEAYLKDNLPLIFADPDRIQQILFNLVSNAVKYTNQGDRVVIGTDFDADNVLLIVTDHGPGIPENEIPQLFDLFHRTKEARQSKVKGLGLGLFIVKSIVDLHNGHISTTSQLGKGTQFTISFPVRPTATGGSE